MQIFRKISILSNKREKEDESNQNTSPVATSDSSPHSMSPERNVQAVMPQHTMPMQGNMVALPNQHELEVTSNVSPLDSISPLSGNLTKTTGLIFLTDTLVHTPSQQIHSTVNKKRRPSPETEYEPNSIEMTSTGGVGLFSIFQKFLTNIKTLTISSMGRCESMASLELTDSFNTLI